MMNIDEERDSSWYINQRKAVFDSGQRMIGYRATSLLINREYNQQQLGKELINCSTKAIETKWGNIVSLMSLMA